MRLSVMMFSEGDAGVAGEMGVIPVDDEFVEGSDATAEPYKSSIVCTTSDKTIVSQLDASKSDWSPRALTFYSIDGWAEFCLPILLLFWNTCLIKFSRDIGGCLWRWGTSHREKRSSINACCCNRRGRVAQGSIRTMARRYIWAHQSLVSTKGSHLPIGYHSPSKQC